MRDTYLLITPGKLEYLSSNNTINSDSYWIENEVYTVHLKKIIKKLFFLFDLPFKCIWYPWKNMISKFDTIIIFDTKNAPYYVKYINKNFPQKRVIIWYCNPVIKTINPNKFSKYICELWSFDQHDCKKYGLKYNTQFYQKNFDIDHNSEYDCDFIFVGQDKGRLNTLKKLQDKFHSLGFVLKLYVINSKLDSECFMPYLHYEDIIKLYSKCKGIVDIQQYGQSGLSLRPLEALFYEKKLITNNKLIMKYDFYKRSNIFILGMDNIETLNDFIQIPYSHIDMDVVHYYDIINWLDRFEVTK